MVPHSCSLCPFHCSYHYNPIPPVPCIPSELLVLRLADLNLYLTLLVFVHLSVAGVVNEETWKELVLESTIPVLVDFWAPWCGPCRMIAPLIDEIAKQYAGKIKCLKLNTDESPGIATEYGIRSIPTVMLFKNGEKKDTVIGAVPKSTLATTVEKYITL